MVETRLEGVIEISADTSKAEASVNALSGRTAGGLVGGAAGGFGAVKAGGTAIAGDLIKAKAAILGFGFALLKTTRGLASAGGSLTATFALFDLEILLLKRAIAEDLEPAVRGFLDALVGATERGKGLFTKVLDTALKGAEGAVRFVGNAADLLTDKFGEERTKRLDRELEGKSIGEQMLIVLHEMLTAQKETRDELRKGSVLAGQDSGLADFEKMVVQQRKEDVENERKRREQMDGRSNSIGQTKSNVLSGELSN